MTKAHFDDWPIRRPLHHGFYRLRATALREGREDYANVIHEQCREWLTTGTLKQHLLLVDLAVALLADEFRITQRFSRSADLALEWSTQRLIRFSFEHVIAVAADESLEISDAARYDISIDLIGQLQVWAGDLLTRNDLESLGVWLERARAYMAVMWHEGTEPHRLGTMAHGSSHSLSSHVNLAVAAIAGRALQIGNDAALDLWGQEMDYGMPPAFSKDQVASDMPLLKWTPALPVLNAKWEGWLKSDVPRKHSSFAKSNRYPLLGYLWLAARKSSIRDLRPEPGVRNELLSLYAYDRKMLLDRAFVNENRRSEIDGELQEWVGLIPPPPTKTTQTTEATDNSRVLSYPSSRKRARSC